MSRSITVSECRLVAERYGEEAIRAPTAQLRKQLDRLAGFYLKLAAYLETNPKLEQR